MTTKSLPTNGNIRTFLAQVQDAIRYPELTNLPGNNTFARPVSVTFQPPLTSEEESTYDALVAEFDSVESALTKLINNATLVRQFPNEVADIFNACYVNWNGNDDLDTAYTAIKAVIDVSPNAIKNRIERRLLRVYGINVATITLDVQKQGYIDNANIFVNGLMNYLLIDEVKRLRRQVKRLSTQ